MRKLTDLTWDSIIGFSNTVARSARNMAIEGTSPPVGIAKYQGTERFLAFGPARPEECLPFAGGVREFPDYRLRESP